MNFEHLSEKEERLTRKTTDAVWNSFCKHKTSVPDMTFLNGD